MEIRQFPRFLGGTFMENGDVTPMYPHFAPRDGDAALADQLAEQSRRLFANLVPLTRLLELVPGANTDAMLADCVPQLSLQLFGIYARQWTSAEMPSILRAFSELARHSRRLDAFPVLKMHFWLAVLESELAHTETRDVEKHDFMRPTFPEFVVDFGGVKNDPRSRYFNEALEARPFDFDEALEDALVAFMTTPSELVTPAARSSPQLSPRPLSFGFVFKNCSLRVESLARLERFLDRTFASATRQFDLHKLEVSDDHLMMPDLEVLARIVHKCVREYGVRELNLDHIIPGSVGGPRPDWVYHKTTPSPVLEMACTFFLDDRLPVLASRQRACVVQRRSSLRKLSMTKNHFCLELFATRFSALRYGCSLHEDMTTYMAKDYWTKHEEGNKEYWRWLAFGLFYPRPRRFRSRFNLHSIGHVDHCPLSFKRYVQTVHNPAAELIFDGKNEHGGDAVAPTTELMVCVLKAGARVDLFQTGRSETPEWTDEFTEACELEAIYERADGAVCVVVPGVGLGWVGAVWVERIEREPLSSARSEQDGLYAGDLGFDTQWRSDACDFWESKKICPSMKSMVETFGRQFYALSFARHCFKRGFLPIVLDSCPNLTHLNLSSQKIPKEEIDSLLDALRGPLGTRLQSLNLDYIKTSGRDFVNRLIPILGDAQTPLALRQVRLIGLSVTNAKQLEALHTALQANSTIAEIRLSLVSAGWRPVIRPTAAMNAQAAAKRRLDAAFHGQVLRAAVPIESKIAFLSAMEAMMAPPGFDAWVLSTIFSFAAEREVRRSIVWCGSSITPMKTLTDIEAQSDVLFGGT